MKRMQFSRLGHETLRHLIGREISRGKMQTSSGKVAQVHVPSEQELDAAKGKELAFPSGSWVVDRDTSIDPDHPEWFDDCKCRAPPATVSSRLILGHSRVAANKDHLAAIPRSSALGRI